MYVGKLDLLDFLPLISIHKFSAIKVSRAKSVKMKQNRNK